MIGFALRNLEPNGSDAHGTATAARDTVETLNVPQGTVACVLAIETAPIRVSFTDQDPQQVGLFLRRGEHASFPITSDTPVRFVSGSPESDARVSVLWLKKKRWWLP
jgi:hypothetical protein